MRIDGEWALCEDGVLRPVIRGEVLAADGSWLSVPFLVDTGADRTVLSAAVFSRTGLFTQPRADRIGGLGGVVDSVTVETRIRLTRDNAGKVLFRGEFAAVKDNETLDMSVLGRDVTGLFAAIVDQPGNRVCLVRERHRYRIEQG